MVQKIYLLVIYDPLRLRLMALKYCTLLQHHPQLTPGAPPYSLRQEAFKEYVDVIDLC